MPQSASRVFVRVYGAGLKAGMRVHRTLYFLVSSRRTSIRVAKCFLLNGAIFLGSIIVLECLLLPLLHWIARFMENHVAPQQSDIAWDPLVLLVERFAKTAFKVLWLLPTYAISFILNTMWYYEIAEQVFKQEYGQLKTCDNAAVIIRDELYRMLLMLWFSLQTMVVYYTIPYVGTTLSVVLTAWMYSFYCFDYKWTLQGWGLERRLRFFERHWVYMLGFGTPCALFTTFLPQFLGYGVYALIFPMSMVLSIISKPLAHTSGKLLPSHIPIFYLAQRGNLTVLRWLGPPPPRPTAQEKKQADASCAPEGNKMSKSE